MNELYLNNSVKIYVTGICSHKIKLPCTFHVHEQQNLVILFTDKYTTEGECQTEPI